MLVLSRKPNESIVIGPYINLRVLSIKGNKVYLGFDAPNDVPILRAELLAAPLPHSSLTEMGEECKQ